MGRATWAALAILALAACPLDLTGAACNDDDNCPVNQYCQILPDQEKGRCVSGTNPAGAGSTFVIDADNRFLPLGGTAHARALLIPVDGGMDAGQDVTAVAQWTPDNPFILVVSSDGGSPVDLLALAQGQTNLTATYRVTLSRTISASVTVVVSNAQLQSLTVTPDRPVYAPGTVGSAAATGFFSDGTHADLTSLVQWSSDTPAVVTISNASGSWGGLTAGKHGTATITASYQDLEGNSLVGVSTASLLSLSLAPLVERGVVDGQLQLDSTGLFSDGTVQPMTRSVQWSLDDPQLGYFGAGAPGTVTLLSPGVGQVQAVFGSIRAESPLEIGPASPVQLEISPWWPDPLGVGTSLQLRAWATTSEAIVTAAFPSWSSSSPVLPLSPAGMLQGIDAGLPGFDGGLGTVTAQSNGLQASTSAEVTAAPPVYLGIWPPQPVVPLGLEVPLRLERGYLDGTAQDMSQLAGWRAADAGAVDVDTGDRGGTVRARQSGLATVEALLPGRTAYVAVRTPEGNPTSLEVVPPFLSIPRGTRARLAAVAHWPDGTLVEVTSGAAWTPSPGGLALAGNGPAAGSVLGLDAGSAQIRASFAGVVAQATLTVEPDAGTLELWPPAPTLAAGTALPIAVTLLSDSGDSSDVSAEVVWTSTDPTLAVVSNAPGGSPALLAKAPGQVSLLGRMGGLAVTSPARVTGAGLASLEVEGPAPLLLWAPAVFRAVGHFSDGSLQDLTRSVSWTSSRPGRLHVLGTGPERGAALALSSGSVDVRARPRGGPMVPRSVEVNGTALASLSIAATPLVAGTQAQLHATGLGVDGTPADVTGSVEWSSSDPSVATVSSLVRPGWVKALAAGTVTLQARLGSVTGSTSLTVGGDTLTGLSVAAPASLATGQTGSASAVATLSGGGTQSVSEDVVWSSNSPGVLAISNARGARGNLMALSPGTATVTARARVKGSPALVATATVVVH